MRRRRRWLIALLAVVAAAIALAAVVWDRDPAEDASSRLPVRDLRPSEISYKADLVEDLPEPPQLVFFGGSRSERFDPVYAREVTGLPTFNFSVTNGRPEAAYAVAGWLLDRSPQTKLRWVWGVQASTLWDRPLDPGLLQDPRFVGSFPRTLLRDQLLALPPGRAPERSFLDNRRYSRRGLLVWNRYDARRARGLTLQESLERYIRQAVKRMERVSASGGVSRDRPSRARGYFRKTLRLLNDHGITPLIVLMPVHPDVLKEMRAHGRQRSREKLLEYLRSLQGEYTLEVLDLTDVSSFGGDPDGFYDGVHITRQNARRAFDRMVVAAPGAFR